MSLRDRGNYYSEDMIFCNAKATYLGELVGVSTHLLRFSTSDKKKMELFSCLEVFGHIILFISLITLYLNSISSLSSEFSSYSDSSKGTPDYRDLIIS